MLPGSPQAQNTIPMTYFGSDAFAAPVPGIIAAILIFGPGMLWLTRREKAACSKREGYGSYGDEEKAEQQSCRAGYATGIFLQNVLNSGPTGPLLFWQSERSEEAHRNRSTETESEWRFPQRAGAFQKQEKVRW